MEPKLKERLTEFAKTDPAAYAFFRGAVDGETDRGEVPLDAMVSTMSRNGQDIGRSELIRVLRRLEELGCGRYSEPGDGQPGRFAWRAGMPETVRRALDEV